VSRVRCHVCTQRRSSLFSAAIFFAAVLGASAQSQVSVPGMSKYTDSEFGFSFWYPTSWKITERAVTDPTSSGWFQGGTIVKELDLANPKASDDDPPGVIIQEFSSSTNSITELGHTESASPVGADQRYFFDSRTHTWMVDILSSAVDDGPPRTLPADVSNNTMGGLHIFDGAARHAANCIVALSPTKFLVLSTMDVGGDFLHRYLAKTVVAAGSEATKEIDVQEQASAIHKEGVLFGAIAVPIGGGRWYRDGEHIYDHDGTIIPSANPKTFHLISQEGPGSYFATDGVHVYLSDGEVIPGADPATFEVIYAFVAKDAHHRYEWPDGQLSIGGVRVPKKQERQ
jgi:hypothetical protein